MNRIERTIIKESQRVIKVARKLYPIARSRDIVVMGKELDQRFAALASFRTKTIYFNSLYFIPGNVEKFVTELVPHEIAHIVSDWVYPDAKYAHGKEWREVCVELGGIPRAWVNLVQD